MARQPEIGHAHAHSHEPAPPASARLRRLLFALLAPFALVTIAGLVVLYPGGELPTSKIDSGTPVNGTVTTASAGSCARPGQVDVDTGDGDQAPKQRCLTLDIELTDGPAAGSSIRKVEPIDPARPRFAPGDPVVLAFSGNDPTNPGAYQLRDFQRGMPILALAGLFALAVLLLGRWQGARALVALALTFCVLAFFILPAILGGEDPLLAGIVGAGLIMFVTLYLTHGLSARTSVAVLGTLVSLVLIGVIAAVFAAFAKLTGIDESTATLMTSLGHGIDARGLLLAGVVIGALGVLDDITVTQASAVWELHAANPSLGWRRLYGSALRIGRDHVASAVNTLVLAYAGAALPLLLFSALADAGTGSILSSQDIAQEILRTLAGSIGIVAAVPVTTALAALVVRRERMTDATDPA